MKELSKGKYKNLLYRAYQNEVISSKNYSKLKNEAFSHDTLFLR